MKLVFNVLIPRLLIHSQDYSSNYPEYMCNFCSEPNCCGRHAKKYIMKRMKYVHLCRKFKLENYL